MRMVDHGGSCCGVRHIYNMDRTTVAELERLMAELAGMHNNVGPNAGRLIEIILSQRQVTGDRNPPDARWTDVLQAKGFRLVSRFLNANSGNDCYVFHYVPHFKSIRPADLPFAWEHNNRAVNLDAADAPRVAPAVPAPRFRVGNFVTVQNGRMPLFNGEIAQITAVLPDGLRLRWPSNRHEGNYGNGTYTFTESVPPLPLPTVVANFYANSLRNGRGALHPTLEAARAAAPRCRQQDRLEILSDGTQRWTEDV